MNPNRTLRAAAVAVALLSLPTSARAQDAERDTLALVHVPPIVVTATRSEAPVERVASDIEAIDRPAIERSRHATTIDLLRHVPGAAVAQSGPFGGVASVFLRGAPSEHTLVLIDGVEVNDPASPAGAFDFGNLAIDDVERIEVLKGPQSPLYGSAAMGGVVQIFTRPGGGPTGGSITLEGGAFGSWRAAGTAAGSSGPASWAFTASHRATDGISAAAARLGADEEDANRSTTLSGTLGWVASERVDLRLRVRGRSSAVDLDQDGADDPNFDTEEDAATARLEAGVRTGEWGHTIAFDVARFDRETVDRPDAARPETASAIDFEGQRWTAEWIARGEVGPGTLTGGAEWERERAETAFSGTGPFGDFEGGLPEETARTAGAFLQHRASFGERLHLTVGGRIDHHDAFGAAGTWRVAGVVPLAAGRTRLKGTLGTGFKAPTLSQLFDPQFGNAELEAERSLGWDGGVEADLAGGRLRLEATAFGTTFDDMVAFETDGFRNVAEASTSGVELEASVLASDRVRVRGSYVYTDARDEEADEALLRRPRHEVGADLEAVFANGADATLGARRVGEREDLDFSTFPAERVELDPYTLLRVGASWPLGDALRVFGRVENLLDEDYEEVLNFGTPGRAAYVGVKLDR